ncbi:MAG TPA: hypothetical protein VK445_08555 [Dissulfurispiraceae bacterium]|nr:hypothetical protein [Dissulfurispiraceae bacterium]
MQTRWSMGALVIFATAATALILTFGAFAEGHQAEQPAYSAGDYWIFVKTGSTETEPSADASDVKDNRLEYVGEQNGNYAFTWNGKPHLKDKNLTTVGNVKGYPGPILKFPLTVGKTWTEFYEGGYAGAKYTHRILFNVDAYEKIKVPAGEFMAYKITAERRTQLKQAVIASHTYWYSPEVKQIIKGTNYELKEYKLK